MKKQFIKITVISILSFLVSKGLFAQHDHEFSLYGGGGLSTLSYKVTTGDQKQGFGGHFGLGYHYFFSPKWGMGTGAELAFYNARFNVDNFNTRYNTHDKDGDLFEFRSAVNGYKEKQRAMMLQIPLMLQFQTKKTDRNRQFFASAGAKAGIPLKEKYSATVGPIKNAGWYEYEQSLYDTQEFMGFGEFAGRKTKGSLDFKTAFFLSAETGFKWRLHEKWSLYAGLYVDYGLNKIVKTDNYPSLPSFVAYNSVKPTEFSVNSIVKSQYAQGGAPQAFTEKIRPIAAGIKVRLTFGKNGKQPQPQPQAQAQPQPAPKPVTDNNAEAKRLAEEEAARKAAAAEEAARKAAAAAEEAARKAAADEAARRAAEKAAMNEAIRVIQTPVDNYGLNQTEPDDAQKKRLDEKIALLQKYPNLTFHVQGHTCDIGTNENNERVGNGRDVKAKEYIISKGIDPSRILSNESKRDTKPLVPNTNEQNRRLNRRVQIVVDAY